MKQLSSRQVSLFIFIITCATKLLILPSLLATKTGNSGWFVVLFMFVIDSLFFLIIFSIMKIFPNLSFKNFLEKGCGKIFSKIILFILGFFLIFKVAMLARECYEFYNETSYVDFSWLTYLLPFGLILTYVSSRPIRELGRAVEVLIYFITFSILMAFLFSVPNADYFSVLPFFPKGIKTLFDAMFDYAFWFGDFLILLLFMGDIEYNKKSLRNFYLSYLCAMVIVITLVFLHYALFGSIAGMYKTAIVDVTEYVPRLSTSGRFTWVIVFLWPIAIIGATGIYHLLATRCFQECFCVNNKNKKYVATCVACLSLGVLITSGFSQTLLIIYITKFVKYFVFIVQYLIPMFFPLMLINVLKKEKTK